MSSPDGDSARRRACEQAADEGGDEEVAEAHPGGAEVGHLQARQVGRGAAALSTSLGPCSSSAATRAASIAAIA